jgi:hypothetical protein
MISVLNSDKNKRQQNWYFKNVFKKILTKEVARGGERTRVLSMSFNFSFSPLYRWATAAPYFKYVFAKTKS